MQQLELDRDASGGVRALVDDYLAGRRDLSGLELYYELERATSLLEFHTMLRPGARNRFASGLQQSYGDHNRLLMLALDQLIAGDLEWYRSRVDPADPVPDGALSECFASVAALGLSREVLVALLLAAALHDCGMLCGLGAHVDVEDGVVVSRPILDELCPAGLRDLAAFVLHHHDYIKGAFLGEVPVGLVAAGRDALPPAQRPLAMAGLGCVQVAGAASLGEGRLSQFRVDIFRCCLDGSALSDTSTSTRLARLLEGADGAVPADLDGFLERSAVHGWQRVTAELPASERVAILTALATATTASGADHVVFADRCGGWQTAGDLDRTSTRVVTPPSGVKLLVVDP